MQICLCVEILLTVVWDTYNSSVLPMDAVAVIPSRVAALAKVWLLPVT